MTGQHSQNTKKLVWDLPLRLFHWLFGLSILAAWLTAEIGEEQIHMWIGYLILSLLLFRISWGLFGTRHSLFWNFLPRPKTLFHYLAQAQRREHLETVGHNPLGSLMVIAMILLVGLQATTGLFTEGEIWSGPYSSAVDSSLKKTLESLHHSNFDFIMLLIAIHVIAIALHYLVKKQNLVLPMITGWKKPELVPEGEDIESSKIWLAFIIAVLVAGFVYWLVVKAPPPVIYDDYY